MEEISLPLDQFEIGKSKILEIPEEPKKKAVSDLGYRIARDGIEGWSLFAHRKNGTKALVLRLKEDILHHLEEVLFWGDQLAILAEARFSEGFDFVSSPPPSIKRQIHLASILAQRVATLTGHNYVTLFFNEHLRGTRQPIVSKLQEEKEYSYIPGEGKGRKILMIDDFLCTGSTAITCNRLTKGDSLRWLFLCQS